MLMYRGFLLWMAAIWKNMIKISDLWNQYLINPLKQESKECLHSCTSTPSLLTDPLLIHWTSRPELTSDGRPCTSQVRMRGDPTCRVTSPLGEDFTLRDSAVTREAGGSNLKDNLQTSQIGDLTGSDILWAVILWESGMVDYTLNGEIKWINAAHNHICTVIFCWWDALPSAGVGTVRTWG